MCDVAEEAEPKAAAAGQAGPAAQDQRHQRFTDFLRGDRGFDRVRRGDVEVVRWRPAELSTRPGLVGRAQPLPLIASTASESPTVSATVWTGHFRVFAIETGPAIGAWLPHPTAARPGHRGGPDGSRDVRARGDAEYLSFPDTRHGIAPLENRITPYKRVAALPGPVHRCARDAGSRTKCGIDGAAQITRRSPREGQRHRFALRRTARPGVHSSVPGSRPVSVNEISSRTHPSSSTASLLRSASTASLVPIRPSATATFRSSPLAAWSASRGCP